MTHTEPYTKDTRIEVSIDDNGYGTMTRIFSKGEVYETEHLTDLWVNYEGFNGAEYDTHIGKYEQDILTKLFKNIQKV